MLLSIIRCTVNIWLALAIFLVKYYRKECEKSLSFLKFFPADWSECHLIFFITDGKILALKKISNQIDSDISLACYSRYLFLDY